MAQRIKGQECELSFSTPDGSNEEIFDDVLELEITVDMEILEEAYLGKTANDFDDIFKGIRGKAKVHMQGATLFALSEKIQDRAQRRLPADGKFNLSTTFKFPSGARARLTLEDLFFGPIPFNIPKREEYVTGELEFACSKLRRIL